jgi:hypothetical protein
MGFFDWLQRFKRKWRGLVLAGTILASTTASLGIAKAITDHENHIARQAIKARLIAQSKRQFLEELNHQRILFNLIAGELKLQHSRAERLNESILLAYETEKTSPRTAIDSYQKLIREIQDLQKHIVLADLKKVKSEVEGIEAIMPDIPELWTELHEILAEVNKLIEVEENFKLDIEQLIQILEGRIAWLKML